MGIPVQVIKAFIAEAKVRSNSEKETRKIALFGKQTVHASRRLLREEFNIDVKGGLTDKTRHAYKDRQDSVADIDLLRAIFPDADVHVFDRSDYEGAGILADLNEPLPKCYHDKYDLVYTGGCLDNVFNPVALLLNSSRLLSQCGSVIHYESASNLLGAYQYFSQEWFYSYYAVNRFIDCQVFLLNHKSPGRTRFEYKTDLFRYKPYFTRSSHFDYLESAETIKGIYYNLAIAQRGPESSCDSFPIQMQYLDKDCIDWRVMEESYCRSPRINAITEMANTVHSLVRPFLSDHYSSYGTDF